MAVLSFEIAFEILEGQRSIWSLEDFSALSDEAAEVLGNLPGLLPLNGLLELNATCARFLARPHQGNTDIELNGLTLLEADAAQALFCNTGCISLKRLEILTTEVARSLEHHRGEILFGQAIDIPQDSAVKLRRHQGDLNVSGLITISDKSLGELALHGGELYLLNQLSDIEESLLPTSQINLFMSRRLTTLHFDGEFPLQEFRIYDLERDVKDFKALDDSAAHKITAVDGGTTIDLSGLATISLRQVEVLLRCKGEVYLGKPALMEDAKRLIDVSDNLILDP